MERLRSIGIIVTALGLVLISSGLVGHDAQILLGLGVLGYGLACFIALGLSGLVDALGDVFDWWISWEPNPRPETGQGLLEYGLLIILIGIAVLVVIFIFGESLVALYGETIGELKGVLG